jgi:hypothetical protein
VTEWMAVVTDADGFVLTDEDLRGWAEAIDAGRTGWGVPCESPTSVQVVTRSARPRPQSDTPGETVLRMPGSWMTYDKLFDIDFDDEEPCAILRAWERAQACAAGLNAAGIA